MNRYVKKGYSGIEFSVGNNYVIAESEEKIKVTKRDQQIKDIKDGIVKFMERNFFPASFEPIKLSIS